MSFERPSSSSTNTVRETVMRQSYVVSSAMPVQQRSFISTSLVNDSFAFGDDLRKSRIQNLPNYKKTNLGENIQFIVVFQTIQIERLSNEVEVLRVRLKENQRQLFNFQNYQVQIRELTQKCFSLQMVREQYRDEIDRYTKICENLYHENQELKRKLQEMDYSLKQKYQSQVQKNSELLMEIQKWKNRYQATEKSKAKELQDLRNLMQSQRKSMIDREIRQIQIRFQNERSNLENQIRKCRQIVENRNREIADLKQINQKQQITIMQLRNYENLIAEHENKIVLLNQQLMRGQAIAKEKEEQINHYKQRQYQLIQQLKEQAQWEHENKQLRTALDNRLKQIEDWKVRSGRLEDQANRAREMIHYNDELTNKLQVSGKEIERLNNVLRLKIDQSEQWKMRYQDKEAEIGRLKNVENEIANHVTRYGMLQAENDRITNILKSRQAEIEDLKQKHIKLQTKVSSISVVEQQKLNLQNRLNDQVKAGQQMQFLIKKLEKEISTFKVLEQKNRDLQRDNNTLVKDNQRLNNTIRNKTNQLKDSQAKNARLEATMTQYKNIEIRIKQFQNRVALLNQEKSRLEDLNNNYKSDIARVEKQKINMMQQANHYKSYEIKITENENTIKRLNDQINKHKQDNQEWQKRLRELENKNRQLDNHLFNNTQDKQRINNNLRAKANQYELLRNRYAELEANSRKMEELQNVCRQQYNSNLSLHSQNEKHIQRLTEYEQTIERERETVSQLGFRVIVLSCEVERLMGGGGTTGGMKSREYEELKQNYSRLQTKMTSKNNEIDILLSKVSNLQSRVSELSHQYQNLLVRVERAQNEGQTMNAKIEEYQDYARRIHILGAEIDRLRAENKALDEDAKKIRLKFADGLSHDKKFEDLYFMQVLMGVQIESVRIRLDQREVNMDEMRKSILQPVRRV